MVNRLKAAGGNSHTEFISNRHIMSGGISIQMYMKIPPLTLFAMTYPASGQNDKSADMSECQAAVMPPLLLNPSAP